MTLRLPPEVYGLLVLPALSHALLTAL